MRRREAVQQQIETLAVGAALAEEAGALAAGMRAGTLGEAELAQGLERLGAGLATLDGTLRRFLIGDVPWRDWAGPLGRWALLVGCTYLVLMAFNVLVFRQWAHHEKLIYPLAELPLALLGLDSDGRPAPSLYRRGLFWAGFAVSGLVLGYNILVATQRVPGLRPLELNNDWRPYIINTGLEGLINGKFSRSHVFFTMIGLSFLIPKKVSFSLWFFSVLSMAQVLLLVSLGHGQNEASFQQDWFYTLNFR